MCGDVSEKLGCLAMPLGGGFLKPSLCLFDIERRPPSGKEHPGKVELRFGVSLFRGRLHPPKGERIVLRDALARPVERGQLVLSFSIVGFGSLLEDRCRSAEVARSHGNVDRSRGGALSTILRRRYVHRQGHEQDRDNGQRLDSAKQCRISLQSQCPCS
jgi:hypothetical protein